MAKNVRDLLEEHQTFYEVMPYQIVLEEAHGTPAARIRRIQAGFDVDVYGTKGIEDPALPVLSTGYAPTCASLLELVKTISCAGGCFIDVIPFGSTVFLNTKNHLDPQAMLRLRITHCRGLEQPAGLPEQRALEEIQEALRNMGVAQTWPRQG